MDKRKMHTLEHEGKELVSIGHAAEQIDRSVLTIKHWYQWAEETGNLEELPTLYRIGKRQIRYFEKDAIPELKMFRDNMQYGKMGDYNSKRWGVRGQEIQERKSE